MRVEIHVPHTKGAGQAGVMLGKYLAKEHGGFYATRAFGFWYNDDGELVRDKITIFTSYDIRIEIGEIQKICEDLAVLLNQEAIFYAINENGHLAFPDSPVSQIPLRNRY